MAVGRKIKPPDPEKLERFFKLCEKMDIDSAALASGLKRSTCWRWFAFGEEHSEDDLGEIEDAEEREKARFQVWFWETCAKALATPTVQAVDTLDRAQVGDEIIEDPETGKLKTKPGPDMVAVVAAQFHLKHRVPAYSDKLKIGGIPETDGGSPIEIAEVDDKLRRLRDKLLHPKE